MAFFNTYLLVLSPLLPKTEEKQLKYMQDKSHMVFFNPSFTYKKISFYPWVRICFFLSQLKCGLSSGAYFVFKKFQFICNRINVVVCAIFTCEDIYLCQNRQKLPKHRIFMGTKLQVQVLLKLRIFQ